MAHISTYLAPLAMYNWVRLFEGVREAAEYGEAYSFVFNQPSAGGADDCVLYLKNQDTRNLVLRRLWLSCSVVDQIYMRYGMTGTPAGGTAPVPVNLNTSSSKVASVLTRQHSAITGLAAGIIVSRYYFTTAGVSQAMPLEDAYILGPDGVWTLHVQTAAVNTLVGQLLFYFH